MKTTENNRLIAEFMITQKPTDDFCVGGKDKEGIQIMYN